MSEILSLWRSPLDRVAVKEAEVLRGRQPSCTIGYGEDFSAMTEIEYGGGPSLEETSTYKRPSCQ